MSKSVSVVSSKTKLGGTRYAVIDDASQEALYSTSLDLRLSKFLGSRKFKKMGYSIINKINEEGEVTSNAHRFDINKRFDMMTQMVQTVAGGFAESLIVTGEGGLGKTFTVNKTISNMKKEAVTVKGYMTAKALFAELYENRDGLVIFDDCDSILKDDVSVNILKAALDSYDERIITWGTKGFIEDDLPKKFEFKGQVIFISNLPHEKIDQAIRTRALTIDLSMTHFEKLERMERILPDVLPQFSMAHKTEIMEFLKANHEDCKNFSMRTLTNAIKLREANENGWEDLVSYLMAS